MSRGDYNTWNKMRIELNEKIQYFVAKEDKLVIENAKKAIAETYFLMGNKKKGEDLFESYLKDNTEWGWGWIGWSDQYWLCKRENSDYIQGEKLLQKALNIPSLKDRNSVEDRLLELYSESEQEEKLIVLEKKLK